MNITRTLQSAPATLSESWYEDGVLVDPGTVTLGITREDGTVLVAAATATTGSGAAARTYALTTTQAASLDMLTVTWISPTKGTRTSYVEVVGGFLFSVTDARALKPLDNTTLYPTAAILVARTLAEMALEDACGVAFVPRYNREQVDGDGTTDLLLEKPRPLSLTAATIGGTAIITSDVELYRDGRLYYANGWTLGRRNVVAQYTHGYATPPPRVGRACLLLAKRFLVDSPISDRATSIVNPDGTQFLVTAGVRDAVFDVPEANAVLEMYGMRFGVG